jgi:hypothetical protein
LFFFRLLNSCSCFYERIERLCLVIMMIVIAAATTGTTVTMMADAADVEAQADEAAVDGVCTVVKSAASA